MSVSARVEGVDRLVDTIHGAGTALDDLDPEHAAAADVLVAAALPRTPVASGALVATVRASVVDGGVVLTAGGSGVDYAAIVHARHPYLSDAIAAQTDRVVDLYATAVEATVDTIKGAS